MAELFERACAGGVLLEMLHLHEGQGDVAQRCFVWKEVEHLEDGADMLTNLVDVDAGIGDVDALEVDRPLGGLFETSDALQDGALPRPGGPEDTNNLPFVRLKANAPEHV